MKKNSTAILLIILALSYFASRLINLKIIPMFTDEAIYSHWAQIALHDFKNIFISLEDGKQPLFIWISAIFQKSTSDPLTAGRLVSVITGFISLNFIYFLSKKLFNGKVAIIASILYICLPFTLLYDRIGLYDSLLTAIGLIIVYLSLGLIEKLQLKYAVAAGAVSGLGLITKSSANFFLYLLPALIVFLKFKWRDLKIILAYIIIISPIGLLALRSQNLLSTLAIPHSIYLLVRIIVPNVLLFLLPGLILYRYFKESKLIRFVSLVLITVFISMIMYNFLRISPLFYLVKLKNHEFIRTSSEVLAKPTDFTFTNFIALNKWIIEYVSLPLYVTFILSGLYGLFKKNKKILYLLAVVALPFSTEVVFNKILYPRFMLFYFPYFLIICSYGIDKLSETAKSKILPFILTASVLILPVQNSYKLLTSPKDAKIATSDSQQYTNGWPSGYGLNEVRDIVKADSLKGPVYVATEGTFGLLPFGLNIYFYGKTNPKIESFWPVDPNNLQKPIIENARFAKSYMIFYQYQGPITNTHLRLVHQYQQGNANSFMRLYEIEQ